MMADIHQIQSNTGCAFVNVETSTSGSVGVWGNKSNTVLALKKSYWFVYTFESDEHLSEWWQENAKEFDKLILVEELK